MVLQVIVPPAGPVVSGLMSTPGVKQVLDAMQLRLIAFGNFTIRGQGNAASGGSKFFGTTSTSGAMELGLEAQVALESSLAKASAYVGGSVRPSFTLHPNFRVTDFTFRGYVGVNAYVWVLYWRTLLDRKWTMDLPLPLASKPILPLDFAELSDNRSWQPLTVNYLQEWGPTDELAAFPATHASAGEQASILLPIEVPVVLNVLPNAMPAMTTTASHDIILFTQLDPGKPWYASTDVGFARRDAELGWQLHRLNDDLFADIYPAVVSGATSAMAAWLRTEGDLSSATEPTDVFPHLEVVASAYDADTQQWTAPTALTNNLFMDRDPLPVAFGETEGVLWIQNQEAEFVGSSTAADTIFFSRWNGNTWESPSIVWEASGGIHEMAFTPDASGTGWLAFLVDEDGNPDTRDDLEIYALSANSLGWATPTRMTVDDRPDSMITLIAPLGAPRLIWMSSHEMLHSPLSSWSPMPVFDVEGELTQPLEVVAADLPAGAALAYTVQAASGVDIAILYYDPSTDAWSHPRLITQDDAVESSLSLAGSESGLSLAYLKTQTVRTATDMVIDGTTYHIENFSEPGRSDIYFLEHVFRHDLAVQADSLVFSVTNPAPNQMVDIRAIVQNMGDYTVTEFAYAFYDGNPDENNSSIFQGTHVGPLIVGGTAVIECSWLVPPEAVSHQIFLVVDPEGEIQDSNRDNNATSRWATLPDLIVDGLYGTLIGDATQLVTVRIANLGTIPSSSFEVEVRLGQAFGDVIHASVVDGLTVNGVLDHTFMMHNPTVLSASDAVAIFARLDAGDYVLEIDKTNNVGQGVLDIPAGMLITNHAPQWFLPEALVLPRDSGLHSDVVDLRKFITDDDTSPSQMTFRILSQSNFGVATVSLVGPMMSVLVNPGPAGHSRLVLEAQDLAGNRTAASMDVYIWGATSVPIENWKPLR